MRDRTPGSSADVRAGQLSRQANMKSHDPLVDSPIPESPVSSAGTGSPEVIETDRPPPATESIARRRMRVVGRLLGSLLLGEVAIFGFILIFRKGVLPLIEGLFHPEPGLISVLRRTGLVRLRRHSGSHRRHARAMMRHPFFHARELSWTAEPLSHS